MVVGEDKYDWRWTCALGSRRHPVEVQPRCSIDVEVLEEVADSGIVILRRLHSSDVEGLGLERVLGGWLHLVTMGWGNVWRSRGLAIDMLELLHEGLQGVHDGLDDFLDTGIVVECSWSGRGRE